MIIRISSMIGFIGALFSLPLLAETIILHDIGNILELSDVEQISIFLVYVPIFLGLIGSLTPRWIPELSGALLFMSGLTLFIPGFIGFGVEYDKLIWGLITGGLFVVSGLMILFNLDKEF